MSEQSERHIHLKQCSADLNEAWALGQAIRDDRGNQLAGAAFMYLLIAYARSFRSSRSPSGKPLKLPRSIVPDEFASLHDRLLAARDQVLAHSDQAVRDPTLHVAQLPDRKMAFVVQSVVNGADEIDNLDAIISLVEGNLDRLYEEIKRSEEALAVTSRSRRRAV